ncbi:hypothetical protein, partial [Chitinimonas sp.]|uniref:hypothetical protein n=1 Tax=Chitinimonas sp. TaxID=1934313 RepID=UPI0035B1924F
MAAAVYLISAAACAEAPFSFQSTPGKLPKDVVPLSYVVHFLPDLRTHRLHGEEQIDIEVRQDTRRIVLNAHDIQVDHASLSGAGLPGRALRPKLDAKQ